MNKQIWLIFWTKPLCFDWWYFAKYKIKLIVPYLYIYKVVTSLCLLVFVCLFVCLIMTQEPLDWFASNFDSKTRENHRMFLAWF